MSGLRVWSKKRSLEHLRDTTKLAGPPAHWRRLLSRPGWFIAFVRYEKGSKS